MSGLAATRLVKQAAPASATAAPEEVLFNAATFLDKKTDHAAYLYKTLFSVVAIAMSQMATLRPQSPFVWLGIYLLRHSGMCHSVKLSDGRTVVCDGSDAAKPPEAHKSSPDFDNDDDPMLQEPRGNNDTTDEEDNSDNEDEKSWDGKLSASESENERESTAKSHAKGPSSSDSSGDNISNNNSDNETNEDQDEAVKAAMTVQASFRGHRARKEFQKQQHDRMAAHQLEQELPRRQFRSFRHGVRIGRTLYHVMASSNGEVRITDSRTMATTTTSCAGEDAANLAAITACVREAMTPEDPDKKKLRSQATCARALDISSTPGTSEQDFHGLAILHFSSPTAVLYDQNSGQVFIASGGNEHQQHGTGVLQDRKRLSKNPDQVLSQLWKQHFAHVAPTQNGAEVLSGGAVTISNHSDREAVVSLVDSTQHPAEEETNDDQSTISSSSSSSSNEGRACCYVIKSQHPSSQSVPRAVPRTVQTNNFTSTANAVRRVEAHAAVASPSPRLLPRVIRTAHKFGNGCRVMVEINHRTDPVKVVVFEQRTMTSETFLVDRSRLQLPSSQDADDRAWIGAVVRRLRCEGRSPHWTFSLDV